MTEEDLVDWVVERRLDMLSEKERFISQEAAIDEMEKIMEDGIKPGFRKKVGMALDHIRWGEKEIYLRGFRDGVKTMRYLNVV